MTTPASRKKTLGLLWAAEAEAVTHHDGGRSWRLVESRTMPHTSLTTAIYEHRESAMRRTVSVFRDRFKPEARLVELLRQLECVADAGGDGGLA
jgi:hypothetical protein